MAFYLLSGILMMPEGEAFGVAWSWSPDRGLSRSAWAAMCTNQASYPEGVQVLKSRFAEAPEEELCRFLAKQRGDIEKAAKIYGEAVKWREVRLSNEVAGVEYVPRWMWKFDRDLARDNTTVLWVQGAMYNSTAADADAYVEATARLMESIPADSLETLTVLVDTRAHPGMASEPASKVISYMAKVAPVLLCPDLVLTAYALSDSARLSEFARPQSLRRSPPTVPVLM